MKKRDVNKCFNAYVTSLTEDPEVVKAFSMSAYGERWRVLMTQAGRIVKTHWSGSSVVLHLTDVAAIRDELFRLVPSSPAEHLSVSSGEARGRESLPDEERADGPVAAEGGTVDSDGYSFCPTGIDSEDLAPGQRILDSHPTMLEVLDEHERCLAQLTREPRASSDVREKDPSDKPHRKPFRQIHAPDDYDDVSLMIRCWFDVWKRTDAFKRLPENDKPPLAIDATAFIRQYGAKILRLWQADVCHGDWLAVEPSVRYAHFASFLRRGLQYDMQCDRRYTTFFTGQNMREFKVGKDELDPALCESESLYLAVFSHLRFKRMANTGRP